MILKSYLAEQNFKQLERVKVILMHGENDGIKEEFKVKFKKDYKVNEVFNFFQSEILSNENILLEELNNQSLFSNKKIIFLYDISDKSFDIIEEISSNTLDHIKIIIFSGILDAKSKLRKYFEKSKDLIIIPCYSDDARTLNKYIKEQLKDYKNVTPESINLIMENSNLNRRIVNSELKKIKTFFNDKKLDIEDIKKLLNIRITEKFENIRDACLLKKKEELNKLISTNQFLDEDIFYYLIQINSRVRKLLEVKKHDSNIELAMENLKPKIFWKDKAAFIEQTKKWSEKDLTIILQELGNTEITMKKKSYLKKNILIKNLLVNICAGFSSSF